MCIDYADVLISMANDGPGKLTSYDMEHMRKAAEQAKRLRDLLARYRDETPLGHQPHMIAQEVDIALGRA